jgi:hypothetical protein
MIFSTADCLLLRQLRPLLCFHECFPSCFVF